jgi:hypothetical protein
LSLVVPTEIFPGAANPAADANSTLTSWEDVSTDIDGFNIREEGVARRNIRYGAIAPPTHRGRYNTDERTAAITSTASGGIPVILGGDVPPGSIGIGPLTFDNTAEPDSIGIVRFSCEYAINPNGSNTHPLLQIKLAYIIGPGGLGGSGWIEISQSVRRYEFSNGATGTDERFMRGSATIATRFRPDPTIATSNLYFAVFAYLDTSSLGQSARLRNACLEFHTFRK